MKTLILVGGGHAHLYVIKKMKSSVKTGLNVILISEMDKQYYSGMASGSLEGYYSEDDMSVDLNDYCQKHDIRFIKNTVISVEPNSKEIKLGDGSRIYYDYLSFDIGSTAKTNLDTTGGECFYVKPLYRIKEINSKVTELAKLNKHVQNINIVVVGTGAAGIEVGLATKILAESKGMMVRLTFVGSNFTPTSGMNTTSEKSLLKIQMLWEDIQWVHNDPGTQIVDNDLQLESGKKLRYDILIIATGVKGPELFNQSGIKVDENNYMLTNEYLQSVQFCNIFGAGDCIKVNINASIPKNGVYAIKEAKVLVKNLENVIGGKPLKAFKPQKRFLSIIALREGTAIAVYKPFVWMGKVPFIIKKWIDQKYMQRIKR